MRGAEGEERVSKLVFIGKNLDHDELRKGFEAVAYSEERAQKRAESLRFKVGDIVEYKMQGSWRKAEVISTNFRCLVPGSIGRIAPYKLKLLPGPKILVLSDADDFVREFKE